MPKPTKAHQAPEPATPKAPARRGRPRNGGPPKTRITVWMAQADFAAIEAKSVRTGISINALALQAIKEGLTK